MFWGFDFEKIGYVLETKCDFVKSAKGTTSGWISGWLYGVVELVSVGVRVVGEGCLYS
jgi:hypothetical protein